MKKIFTAALFTLLITGTAMATATGNEKVTRLFLAEYANASNIRYSATSHHITINFTWNNQEIKAFYDNEGNKLATSRNITVKSLPICAQQTLHNKYLAYSITEAIEMDHATEGISYYVSMQKEKKKIIVKIYTTGEVTTFN